VGWSTAPTPPLCVGAPSAGRTARSLGLARRSIAARIRKIIVETVDRNGQLVASIVDDEPIGTRPLRFRGVEP
jgi:hypothetical protein